MPERGQVEVHLSSGERVLVEGTMEEVEKSLSDASRSGSSRLAWLSEGPGSDRVAINPAHVTALTPSAVTEDGS